ncbi:uncharacterized protein LOC124828440, partial [Vigna umbellata]|uniref:uncharacterized protein LOC124828440 n=1 Tax=Vigna umbellata TaxID=87088 RepID=UPI001F5EEFF6
GVSPIVYGIENIFKEDLELDRQLKLINKPPVKTIHTEHGDIVDCIDINKQPAFDHPLLKNHKLQEKPNFQRPIGKISGKKLSDRSMFGFDKHHCYKGTVPILRTTKEDLIREKNLLNNSIFVKDISGVHLAEIAVSSKFGPYFSINANNIVYNPTVTKGQMSLSHIWVQNGPINTNNKISMGWHVSPELYGDYDTHEYATWTSDNYHRTGCFNLRCPGFVQTHSGLHLGKRFTNVSFYGGPLYSFRSSISQDPLTKNWWVGIQDFYIGYYPAELFSNLGSADKVGLGGRTSTAPGSPSPPMGSGHFPGNFFHSSFFDLIFVQNASRRNYGPEKYQTEHYLDKPKCYGLKYFGNLHQNVGCALQFGGPGGNCGD